AISASGRLGGAPGRLALDGDSALLRVAAGAQIDVDRTDTTGQPGSLNFAPGAALRSDGAILLDAPGDFHLRGDILMRRGALSLSARQISLGAAPADTPGLALADAALALAQAEELRLYSVSALGLYGAVDFAARQIALDAPGIAGYGAAGETAKLSAELIRVGNAANRLAPTADKLGAGRLALAARRLELADGGVALNGFASVELSAADSLVAVGDAALDVGGDLRLNVGQISAAAGASALLDAGAFAVDIANRAASQPAAGLGGALTIRGGDINNGGTLRLPAGRVALQAAHSLTLSPSALLDVSGQAVSLGGTWHFAPGGSVSLSADSGDLTVQAGARINVDGATQGGEAGALSAQAANGAVRLDGAFSGRAQPGFNGGRLAVDTGRLAGGFSTLNAQAGQGGFNAAFDLRVRQGDLLVAAEDFVQSHSVRLSADSGDLTVDGSIDASGLSAGQVALSAGDQLRLSADARIRAQASAPGQTGGEVALSALDADGDGRAEVSVQAGATIDVQGGPGGTGGSVSVRAPRVGTDDAAPDLAPGTVHGAAKQTAEAVQVYRDLPLTNAQITQWRSETAAFIDAAAQNSALQTRLGGFTLLPGLDIQASGDLSLDLGERLNAKPWTPLTTGASSIYYTQANDLAGAIATLRQLSASGAIRNLQPAASASLNTDGSYFLDTDPASPTFRRLSVRVFPDNTQGANRYNPARIRDSLIEANGWDFLFPAADGAVWRFGPAQVPGVLTLRAAGHLDIRQDLSDGFALYNARQLSEFFGLFGNWRDTWILQTGDSWGYRLVAGADLAAANPLAVSHGLSTLTLGIGASIRTGTGTIDVASSGDILLADQTASLYTAGRPDGQRYGVFDKTFVAQNFNAEYPVEGGNITVYAGRDMIGAVSTQLVSDWLIRTGQADVGDGTGRPTAWGIAFDGILAQNSPNARIQNLKFGFQENIGALGGGDVSIQAGRNIVDLSAMLPTSGKPLENNLAIQGGGDLTVQAGGDLFGGVFYVYRGEADITAGGNILGGAQYSAGPVFALGDAQINVQARGDIAIGAVLNPFFITQAKFTDKPAYFTTYTDASQIRLSSMGGDILFNNDLSVLRQQYKIFDAQSPRGRNVLNSFDAPLLGIYPGSLQAVAFTGAMPFANSFSLYPSAAGALDFFAAHDISAVGNAESIAINQSDLGLVGLLSPALPAQSLNVPGNRLIIDRLYGSDVNPANLHATIPLRQGDSSPVRIVAEYGSINAQNGLLITTAKPADIYAGLEIIGLSLQMQNVDDGAVSKIAAGRDIRYPIQRDPVSGDVLGASLAIEIAGPGQLWVMAGRDIDLGSSDGIRSVGNLLNPGLNAQGAELLVLAGLGKSADFKRSEIADFFGTLQTAAISAAASADPAAKAAAYKTGYQAIQKLFPQANYLGDIKLFFSAIQTLDGGNISLLAPGGLINVGLPTAFSGNKTADQLGIVAQRDGNIDIFALGDLQVNRSRVFALDGGDINVWSSLGDIDAGRGAKSALSAPLPITGFDSFGNLVVTFPPTVSGSGIRAQAGTANGKAGNVTLAAPKGVVDAGEAGIGGQNVVIAATAVIGASNIQVSGTSSGIPQTPAVIITPAAAGNAMAAAGNTISAAVQAQPNASLSPQKSPVSLPNFDKLSTLTVDVLGFGNCSVADVQADKTGC
ncbi:MAG: filamentous hemagglutinin family protein, partial [Candidatus Methylumidiphilus sp.]